MPDASNTLQILRIGSRFPLHLRSHGNTRLTKTGAVIGYLTALLGTALTS
jgi:hypothetical protein